MRSCAQCAFSESRAAHSLECRIRAPEPRTYVATWPTVGPDDWCGEFRASDPPRAAAIPAVAQLPVVQWPTPNLDPLGRASLE